MYVWMVVRVTNNKSSVFANGEGEEAFSFDQEARHTAFLSAIREKDWETVESLLDKKVIFLPSIIYITRTQNL